MTGVKLKIVLALFVYCMSAVNCIAQIAKQLDANGSAIVSVQLANVFAGEDVSEYLVSEKYDGVRAIWKNGELRTRNGNIIHAPSWFVKGWPNLWLDGELWAGRQNFEQVMSTVTKLRPVDAQWKQIRFMVFDAPNPKQVFARRAAFYQELLTRAELEYIKPVVQFKVQNNIELSALLHHYTRQGAEGLMLQKAHASFANGRTNNLLKLKAYMDAEATVIAHLPGKGKYLNMTGALLVRYQDAEGQAVEFKIGTGLSDKQRQHPPGIGSIITFKYHGYTRNGVPRFASFLRVRE